MSTKKIAFQIYSDLHLEIWNKMPEIVVKSKYLILAGDICQISHQLFYNFLDYCSLKWEKIFYVPGNHEYYSKKKNMKELEFQYKYHIEERYKNIYYLNDTFVKLNENTNIYGTVFWTIPQFVSTNEAKLLINDYNNILYYNETKRHVMNLDITHINNLAKTSFDKLRDYLKSNDTKTIIITHFPPITTNTSNKKYMNQLTMNSYFSWSDNTLDKLDLTNVSAWISGHTHWSYDFIKNNVRLISNQLGYKEELGKTGINEDGVYEI